MQSTPDVLPLATELRTLHIGDAWEYAVTGTVTPPDGACLPLQGTIAVSVTLLTLATAIEVAAICFAPRLRTLAADGSRSAFPAPLGVFGFQQDATTHDVCLVADNMGPGGAHRVAQAPQVFYPGRWSLTTAYANCLDFGADGYVENTLTTIGTVLVTTPLGRFTAWKAPITSHSAQMGRIEGTDWWTPQLGAPIQFETVTHAPDGSRVHFAAAMTRTSVSVC